MCNLGGLFGQKGTTESQQSSSGSSTNPLAGTILQYGQQNVLPQYSAGNIANTAASLQPNQYITQGAGNQATATQNLFPAFNAAGNLAMNGVSPASVSQWMSPYTQNVVDAYGRQQDINDGRTLAQAQGSNALTGGLTNSATRGNMDYLRANLAASRGAQAASLYNTGYNTAVGNAFQDASVRNTAANTIGGLLGAQSGANSTLGQLAQLYYGQNQTSAMLPYGLTSQGASTLTGLVPGVGNSFTSSGTSSGTTQQEQGLGTIFSGLLGTYLMGRRAHGGSVMPRYTGHDAPVRLGETVNALRGMFRSEGGAIPRYEGGGVVEPTAAPMPEYAAPAPTPPAAAAPGGGGFFDGFSSILPSYDHGVWKGEKASPNQRFGMALTQIGMNNPFAGFGKSAFEQSNLEEKMRQQERMQQAQMDQQRAIALGRFGRDSTVDARRLDEEIRHNNSKIALEERKAREEGIKVNPITGEYYSGDPKSSMYPKPGVASPDDMYGAAVRKAWATHEAPKLIPKVAAEYNSANDMVNKFNDLEALAPHIVSGSFATQELEARKMLQRLGFGDPSKVAATELARTLTQGLVLDATKNLKPATDLDVKFAEKATASIQSDPSTLPVLLPGLRAVAQRNQLKAELVMRDIKAGKIPDYVDIDKQVDSYIPSPYTKYARSLELGRVDGPAAGPKVAKPGAGAEPPPSGVRTPPAEAITELIKGADNPRYIERFNYYFNGGKPGLAEDFIRRSREPSPEVMVPTP